MAQGFTSAERRAAVAKQLRDRKGRWIEMGAKVRFMANGVERVGEVIGISGNDATIEYRGKNGAPQRAKVAGKSLDVINSKASLEPSRERVDGPTPSAKPSVDQPRRATPIQNLTEEDLRQMPEGARISDSKGRVLKKDGGAWRGAKGGFAGSDTIVAKNYPDLKFNPNDQFNKKLLDEDADFNNWALGKDTDTKKAALPEAEAAAPDTGTGDDSNMRVIGISDEDIDAIRNAESRTAARDAWQSGKSSSAADSKLRNVEDRAQKTAEDRKFEKQYAEAQAELDRMHPDEREDLERERMGLTFQRNGIGANADQKREMDSRIADIDARLDELDAAEGVDADALPDDATEAGEEGGDNNGRRAELDAEIADLEEEAENLKEIGAPMAERKAVNDQLRDLKKERDGLDGTAPSAAPEGDQAAPEAAPESPTGESIEIDEVDDLPDGSVVRLEDTINGDEDITEFRKDSGSWVGSNGEEEADLDTEAFKDYIRARDPRDIVHDNASGERSEPAEATPETPADDELDEIISARRESTPEPEVEAEAETNGRAPRAGDSILEREDLDNLPNGSILNGGGTKYTKDEKGVWRRDDRQSVSANDLWRDYGEDLTVERGDEVNDAPAARKSTPAEEVDEPRDPSLIDDASELPTGAVLRTNQGGEDELWTKRDDGKFENSENGETKTADEINSDLDQDANSWDVVDSGDGERDNRRPDDRDAEREESETDRRQGERPNVPGGGRDNDEISEADRDKRMPSVPDLDGRDSNDDDNDRDTGTVFEEGQPLDDPSDPSELPAGAVIRGPENEDDVWEKQEDDSWRDSFGNSRTNDSIASSIDNGDDWAFVGLYDADNKPSPGERMGDSKDPWLDDLDEIFERRDSINESEGNGREEGNEENDSVDSGSSDLDGREGGSEEGGSRFTAEEVKSAVTRYIADQGYYVDINRTLRNERELSGDNAANVEVLDDIMRNNRTSDDLTVYRGVQSTWVRDLASGDEVTDRGYVSTSRNEDIADEFAREDWGDEEMFGEGFDPLTDRAVFEISVPAGTHAYDIGEKHAMDLDDPDGEQELLLDRSSVLRIDSVEDVGGMKRIKATVLPGSANSAEPDRADEADVDINPDADAPDDGANFERAAAEAEAENDSDLLFEDYQIGDTVRDPMILEVAPIGSRVEDGEERTFTKNSRGEWVDDEDGERFSNERIVRERPWPYIAEWPGREEPAAGEEDRAAEDVPGEDGTNIADQLEPEDGVIKDAPDGRKYVAGANGSALFEGDRVRSTKDGLEGEIVKIEGNGKYVKVRGDDGKVRGRRNTTVEPASNPAPSAPAEAEGGPSAPAPANPARARGEDRRQRDEEGDVFVPSAAGDAIYEGTRVKSRKDGLEGTVVKVESNGQYVQVMGDDGKKRGRKASTLDVVANVDVDINEPSLKPNELDPDDKQVLRDRYENLDWDPEYGWDRGDFGDLEPTGDIYREKRDLNEAEVGEKIVDNGTGSLWEKVDRNNWVNAETGQAVNTDRLYNETDGEWVHVAPRGEAAQVNATPDAADSEPLRERYADSAWVPDESIKAQSEYRPTGMRAVDTSGLDLQKPGAHILDDSNGTVWEKINDSDWANKDTGQTVDSKRIIDESDGPLKFVETSAYREERDMREAEQRRQEGIGSQQIAPDPNNVPRLEGPGEEIRPGVWRDMQSNREFIKNPNDDERIYIGDEFSLGDRRLQVAEIGASKLGTPYIYLDDLDDPSSSQEFLYGTDELANLEPPKGTPVVVKDPDATAESLGLDRPEYMAQMVRDKNYNRTARPGQGAMGDVDIVELPDGSSVVVKRVFGMSRFHGRKDPNKSQTEADAEVLAARLGQAFGIKGIGAVEATTDRNDRGSHVVVMEKVPGKVANSDVRIDGWTPAEEEPDLQDLFNGHNAKRTALLDLLIGNTDRHPGNWFIDGDEMYPIDHGFAWSETTQVETASPFVDFYFGRKNITMQDKKTADVTLFTPKTKAANPWTRSELQEALAQLEAIKPEFETRGRSEWYDRNVAILNGLIERIDESGSIRVGRAVKRPVNPTGAPAAGPAKAAPASNGWV